MVAILLVMKTVTIVSFVTEYVRIVTVVNHVIVVVILLATKTVMTVRAATELVRAVITVRVVIQAVILLVMSVVTIVRQDIIPAQAIPVLYATVIVMTTMQVRQKKPAVTQLLSVIPE